MEVAQKTQRHVVFSVIKPPAIGPVAVLIRQFLDDNDLYTYRPLDLAREQGYKHLLLGLVLLVANNR